MTQYSTDFGTHPTGSGVPSGWTMRWDNRHITASIEADAGSISGKVLKLDAHSAFGRNFLTFNAVDADPNRDVVDLFTVFRYSSFVWDDEYIGLGCRGRNNGGTFEAYSANAQWPDASDRYRLVRWSNYTANVLASVNNAFANNTKLNFRYQVTAAHVHRVKVWQGDPVNDEPVSWLSSVTNSAYTHAGWIGLINVGWSHDSWYEWFGVGTNGDDAPRPTSTGSPWYYYAQMM